MSQKSFVEEKTILEKKINFFSKLLNFFQKDYKSIVVNYLKKYLLLTKIYQLYF